MCNIMAHYNKLDLHQRRRHIYCLGIWRFRFLVLIPDSSSSILSCSLRFHLTLSLGLLSSRCRLSSSNMTLSDSRYETSKEQ